MEPGAEAHYSLSIKYETPMSIVTHPHLPPPPPLDGMLVHRKVTPSQSSGMSPVPFYIWTVSSLFCSKMITRIIARTLTDFWAKQISIQTVYILHHRAKTESDIEAQTLLSKKQRDNNAQNRTYRSEEPLDRAPRLRVLKYQSPVVQTLDSAIHWINNYPAEKYEGDHLRYPLVHVSSG